MSVVVYFKNGNSAVISDGVSVTGQFFPVGTRQNPYKHGILVKNKDGKDVGRFIQDELVGYFISE